MGSSQFVVNVVMGAFLSARTTHLRAYIPSYRQKSYNKSALQTRQTWILNQGVGDLMKHALPVFRTDASS